MTSPFGDPSERNWRLTVERGIQRAFAVYLAVAGIQTSVGLWSGRAVLPVETFVLVALSLSVLVLVAERGWRTKLTGRHVIGVVVVALAALLGSAVAQSDAVTGGARSLVWAAAIAAGGLLRPVTAATVVLTVELAFFGLFTVASGTEAAVEESLGPLAAAVMAAAITRLLRRAAARADSEHLITAMASRAGGAADGSVAEHHLLQRVLHDQVAAVLRTIARGGVSREQVRALCREAVDAIGAGGPDPAEHPEAAGFDLGTAFAEVIRTGGLSVDLTVGGAVIVPGRVGAAFLDAAKEALRNVEFHAGVGSASIRILIDDGQVHVAIADQGAGFDPRRLPRCSTGIRKSIAERMRLVGGQAEIRSELGRGTSVLLSWQPRVDPVETDPADRATRFDAIRAAVGDVRPTLLAIAVPYLLLNLAWAVLHLGDEGYSPWLLGLWGVVSAATLGAIGSADRPMSTVVAVTLVAVAVGSVSVAMPLLPAESLHSYASWPIGAVGPLLSVLAVVRPWRLAVLTCLVVDGIVLAAIALGVLDVDSIVDALPALLAPIGPVVTGVTTAVTMARLGRKVQSELGTRYLIAARRGEREAREATRTQRLLAIRQDIEPFLADAAAARVDPDDPGTRVRAGLLEESARDEIQLPGVLVAGTRAMMAKARAAGCRILIQSDADSPVDGPAAGGLLLAAALAGAGGYPDEVILSVYPDEGGARLSLVVSPGDPRRADALRDVVRGSAGFVDHQPEATEVQLFVARPSA